MHALLLPPLYVFCLLPLMATCEGEPPTINQPHRFVPQSYNEAVPYPEEGVSYCTTILVRDDLGVLVVGCRGVLLALDLKDLSKKRASMVWAVSENEMDLCQTKGRNRETDCKNYIIVMHKMSSGDMYVCGTHAYEPKCAIMSYREGELSFEGELQRGNGRCPFQPWKSSATLMLDDDTLYSAAYVNFLATEPTFSQVFPGPMIRTEFLSSWLKDPAFGSMLLIPESKWSKNEEPDKIFLFFSEIEVECDCVDRRISRLARVCVGDVGGQRILQNKFSSFLKARIDCPVGHTVLPFLVQNSFLFCDKAEQGSECLIYATFIPQAEISDLSAVCVYKVSDITEVFSKGDFKTQVAVQQTYVKWILHTEPLPEPRPGTCPRNSKDLPDDTLQFIQRNPIMNSVITPIGDKALLIRKGAYLTNIVVTQVEATDGTTYRVMFVGTVNNTLVKALHLDDEVFVIEEIELFRTPGRITTLSFSDITGHLYIGSHSGVIQIPPAVCERSETCVDCVLARDPYCGWDSNTMKCVRFVKDTLIQSVKDRDASLCPDHDPGSPVPKIFKKNGYVRLSCRPPSQTAKITWEKDGVIVKPSSRVHLSEDALIITQALDSDIGLYRCISVDSSQTKVYRSTLLVYEVKPEISLSSGGTSISASMAMLYSFLIFYSALNIFKHTEKRNPIIAKKEQLKCSVECVGRSVIQWREDSPEVWLPVSQEIVTE